MEIAIENLNKTVDDREKMIIDILFSKKLTNKQWDKTEKRLQNCSYVQLKKMHSKI